MHNNVHAFKSVAKRHGFILAGIILTINVMISCKNPDTSGNQAKDTLSWVSWNIRYHAKTDIGQINQSKEECMTLINKLVDSFNQVRGLSYETNFNWTSRDSLHLLMQLNLIKPGAWNYSDNNTDSVIDPKPPCPRPGPGTTSVGEVDFTQCVPAVES